MESEIFCTPDVRATTGQGVRAAAFDLSDSASNMLGQSAVQCEGLLSQEQTVRGLKASCFSHESSVELGCVLRW